MTQTHHDQDQGRRKRRIGWAAGLVAIGAIIGGVVAVAMPASADPTTGPSASASAAPPTHNGQPPVGGGQRSGETLLGGTDAQTATAAALKAVPGATVDRVETDADGAVYEAHMTKSDGSKVTVKFDKDFNVTAVQDGMGTAK
jgi:hypothetical protein